MFWKKKRSGIAWRDDSGEIRCLGDNCSRKCDSTCPIWENTIGLKLLRISEPLKAIEHFKNAIELASDFTDAYNNLGSAYGMSNQHEKALEFFAKAYSMKRNYAKALRGMIIAETELGKYEDALKHCDEYESLNGPDVDDLRGKIESVSSDRSEECSWSFVTLATMLLTVGRNEGYVFSEGFPYIPELLTSAQPVCESIYEDILEYKKTAAPNFDAEKMTFIWSAYAGMGAVYYWHIDWNSLAANGLYRTLTAERGIEEMVEYVSDSIGIPFQSEESQELTCFLKKASVLCMDFLVSHQNACGFDAIIEGAKAMFLFGMVFEMNRLGMI